MSSGFKDCLNIHANFSFNISSEIREYVGKSNSNVLFILRLSLEHEPDELNRNKGEFLASWQSQKYSNDS